MALDYIRSTQSVPCRVSAARSRRAGRALSMDAATRASLEILRPGMAARAYPVLYGAANASAAGARRAGRLAFRSAHRPWGASSRARSLVLVHRQPRGDRRLAGSLARRRRHGAGAGPALSGPRQPARPRRHSRRIEAPQVAAAEVPSPPPQAIAGATRIPSRFAAYGLISAALADPRRRGSTTAALSGPALTASSTPHRTLRDESRQVIDPQLDFAQRYGVASLKIRHHAAAWLCHRGAVRRGRKAARLSPS